MLALIVGAVLCSLLLAPFPVPVPGTQSRPPVIVPPPPPPPPPPAGAVQLPAVGETNKRTVVELLDRFQQMSEKLAGGANEIDLGHELSVLANDARSCLERGVLSSAFHARFARLLLVMRLATITDTGRILAPITDREFSSFVKAVTGQVYDPKGPASEQIAMFSDAVATELTRLRVLATQMK
jgi:hypothetical protein